MLNRMRSAAFVVLFVACARSAPRPPPAACVEGAATCSSDGRGIMQCQHGGWVPVAPCPSGCVNAACAEPPPTPCAEGGYECSADRATLMICKQGHWAVASTCRGPRACSVGAAVACDHSIAAPSDSCEAASEMACSTDRKTLLRCSGGTYQPAETCRNGCLSTQGRLLCQ
jgi:hypothetical protein